jgi:trans-aconitate methyltransferase
VLPRPGMGEVFDRYEVPMTKVEMENAQSQPRRVLAVRMPESLREQVHRAAADELTSEAAWARRVIKNALRDRSGEAA